MRKNDFGLIGPYYRRDRRTTLERRASILAIIGLAWATYAVGLWLNWWPR
jgi:hypothetical protein